MRIIGCMPWWFWVLLWTALVAVSAAVLLLLAWRTAARFFAALKEIGILGEDMGDRWEQGSQEIAQTIRRAPVPGVLVPVRQAREDYLRGRSTRQKRKVAQRIARRDRLGQPQRIGDLRYGARKGNNYG